MGSHFDSRIQIRSVIIRHSKPSDIPSLGNLLVQLYAAELPGALTGKPADQEEILRFTLETQLEEALRNRFVLCDQTNQVLATGMIQFPTELDFNRAPPGTLPMAIKLLGYRVTGKLLLAVVRSKIGVYSQRRLDTALLHSIVVNEDQRGQGLGRRVLETLEQVVRKQGYRWIELQVVGGNETARRLYFQNGYRDVWTAPYWVAKLSWSSCVMRKTLQHRIGT